MISRLLPVVLVFAAGATSAQQAEAPNVEPLLEPCEQTGGPDSCVRVVACIGEEGVWFDGRAIGWNTGRIEGQLSTGASCTGEWAYTDDRTSRTVFACDDGTEGVAVAVAQDPQTGTAIAEGMTTDGRMITGWSGRHVLDFLRGPTGDPVLACGERSIVIS